MPSPVPTQNTRGFIVPIGGAEDKVSHRLVLRRFVEACGDGYIAIVPTASVLPDTGQRYQGVFRELGSPGARVLDFKNRIDAEREDWLDDLAGASGIFLTGGNQLRLSTILGGTPVATILRRRNAAGVPVAGTSAGAAFISEHMIAFGAEGSTPIAGKVTLSPGLGLTNRVIVDQHFRQRDRLGRLMGALAYNPFVIGLGIDEDTGAFLGPDNRIEVVGAGGLTVVDVSGLEYSSMSTAHEGQPVELIGVRLHVLVNGASFDLETRRATPAPVPPEP